MASSRAVAAGLPSDATAVGGRRLGSSRLRRLLARGDTRAFEQVFRDHHQEIFRYCRALLGNQGDAEDALQATMAAALRSLPGERRSIEVRPWLFRVAHNESISIIRARRERAEADPAAAVQVEGPSEIVERSERLRTLVVDLRSLPERQRSALVMRELSGLSYGEIAATLGCGEGGARQTVYEARLALEARKEGREMSCEEVLRAIDGGDRRRLRGRRVRAHLAACDSCAGFERAIETRRSDLEALCPPLPLAAGGGILASLLGAGSAKAAAAGGGATASAAAGGAGLGAGGAGAAAAGGGVAATAVAKGAAVVAAVTIAAGTADGVGAIDLPGPVGIGSDADTTTGGGGTTQEGAGAPNGPEPRADGRPGSARAEEARVRGIEASSKRGLNRERARGRKDGPPGVAQGRGKATAPGLGTAGEAPGPPPSSNAGGNGAGPPPGQTGAGKPVGAQPPVPAAPPPGSKGGGSGGEASPPPQAQAPPAAGGGPAGPKE